MWKALSFCICYIHSSFIPHILYCIIWKINRSNSLVFFHRELVVFHSKLSVSYYSQAHWELFKASVSEIRPSPCAILFSKDEQTASWGPYQTLNSKIWLSKKLSIISAGLANWFASIRTKKTWLSALYSLRPL